MKYFLSFICFIMSAMFSFAQVSTSLKVIDSRLTDDAPNFIRANLRVDFKARHIINVPGDGYYSGNITISPRHDGSGGFNHQLNFNNGGIYYRQGDFIIHPGKNGKK